MIWNQWLRKLVRRFMISKERTDKQNTTTHIPLPATPSSQLPGPPAANALPET